MATGLPTAYRYIQRNQKPLRFRPDGKFRILHLTDIHEVPLPTLDSSYNEAEFEKSRESINVIKSCIKLAKPDLIILGGDNISGFRPESTYEMMRAAIKRILKPIEEKDIPLAVIFGNHDSESVYSQPFVQRENQLLIFAEYKNLRSTLNDEDIFGCANCALPILASRSDRIAWNIWCVDSNDYIRESDFSRPFDRGYDFVHSDQLLWRERAAEKLKLKNGGKPVPSLLFQHIPVFQEYDLFEETSKNDPDAFEKFGEYFKVPSGAFLSGDLLEPPCPPEGHREEFESFKKTGDIVAAFFGHDHPNDFTAQLDGIKIVQTPGVRYHASTGTQGGRLIVLDENITDGYETEIYRIPRLKK